ncbi:MAG: hypothetical protein AAF559_13960 [Pseudomonadota bacterium]
MLSVITRTTTILAAAFAFAASPLSAQPTYQTGDVVLGQWSDGLWYPGMINRREGDRYRIAFFDGDMATLPTEDIRRETVEPGDELLVRGLGPRPVRVVLKERYGNALVVEYSNGRRQAVSLSDAAFSDLTTRPGRNPKYYEPRVLANLCNGTEETVYYALALNGQDGNDGRVSQGWGKLAPKSCEIYDILDLWLAETPWQRESAPKGPFIGIATYIYGQTLDAFQNQALGGLITIDKGKRWAGQAGENEFCIMDRPKISFRHVMDAISGPGPEAYCQDDWSFMVPFRAVALPKGAGEKGGALNWTFGE